MHLVLTSLSTTETTVVGAKLDSYFHVMKAYQTSLDSLGHASMNWTLKSLEDNMPHQFMGHCNHSRRIAVYRGKDPNNNMTSSSKNKAIL